MEALAKLRRAAGAAVVDNAFRAVSVSAAAIPASWPSLHDIERVRSIRYRDSSDSGHLLDVYRPRTASEKLPVVLYFHGGGFRILSKDSHWLMGLAFGRAGYLTIVPDYRKAPANTYPAAHEDAFAAYQWAVDNAEAFGGDPNRIIVAGESAGGNLATALVVGACWDRSEPYATAMRDLPPPIAAIPMCAYLQVSDPARLSRRRRLPMWLDDRVKEVAEAYLGTMGPRGGGYDLVDPLVVFERADPPRRPIPPFCMTVGTADPLLDDTRRMEVALARMGVLADVSYYQGEVHAFQAFLWRKNARRSWLRTFKFLDRVLSP